MIANPSHHCCIAAYPHNYVFLIEGLDHFLTTKKLLSVSNVLSSTHSLLAPSSFRFDPSYVDDSFSPSNLIHDFYFFYPFPCSFWRPKSSTKNLHAVYTVMTTSWLSWFSIKCFVFRHLFKERSPRNDNLHLTANFTSIVLITLPFSQLTIWNSSSLLLFLNFMAISYERYRSRKCLQDLNIFKCRKFALFHFDISLIKDILDDKLKLSALWRQILELINVGSFNSWRVK